MSETSAVVIGASVAGLLAASVLAESFSRVTVYDRDTLPDEARARPAAPQTRQAHALQARGSSALEELLPGFTDELVAAGAARSDQQLDVHWPARLFAPATVIRVFRTRRTAARTLRQRARRTVPDSPYPSQAVPVRRSKTSM